MKNLVEIIWNAKQLFDFAKERFGEEKIKEMLAEKIDLGESFERKRRQGTKPHLGLKENKTSRLLSRFGLLGFKKGGR